MGKDMYGLELNSISLFLSKKIIFCNGLMTITKYYLFYKQHYFLEKAIPKSKNPKDV
jgi:hypothetical protein